MSTFNSTSPIAKAILVLFFSCMSFLVKAQIVTTIAGGAGGYLDTTVSKVDLRGPADVVIDAAGNFFIADQLNYVIRKISASGEMTTFAGSGIYGFADGPATTAQFSGLSKIAIDKSGNIYVADNGNARIRKVSPAGVVTTLAGNGVKGFADGLGASAEFHNPSGIAVDTAGNVYVGDFSNNRIRKITPDGTVSTLAGNGLAGYVNGAGTNAEFYAPRGVSVDKQGNVYVVDCNNNRIRKVTASGVVSLVAGDGFGGLLNGQGNNAEFNLPDGITVDSLGNLYVADQSNHVVRKITPTGVVSTLAGNSMIGFIDGQSSNAEFNDTHGVCATGQGNVYVTDGLNNSVRKISVDGLVSTIAGNGLAGFINGQTANAELYGPNGVAVDAAGNMYVAEWLGNRIRKITPAGVVTTIAGNGIAGFVNGSGANAEFNHLSDIIVDAQGNLYVTEAKNDCIRKITPDGTVTTLAGNGTPGFADGQGTNAQFWNPNRLVFDSQGNILVADAFNNRIRKITLSGLVSTTAGNGVAGYLDGSSANAEFNFPNGVAIDATGNIYVADYNNNRIRKISTNGTVSTVAGDGFAGYLNGTGTNSEFNHPGGICIDTKGDFYISDENNNRIRKLSAMGVVSLWAGNGTPGLIDGTADSEEFNDVRALCVDTAGNVFVPDYNNNKIRKITPGSVLAVSLFSFSVQLKNSNAILNWQTVSEINSNHFNIQRSNDGAHFNTINKVLAAGSSSNINDYTYTDLNVTSLNINRLYYRLQEVDKDGSSIYSSVQTINIGKAISLFSVSPNPTKDFVNIISSDDVLDVAVKITDMSGRTLYKAKQNFVSGQQLRVTLSQFSNEVLIVTIKSANSNEEFKIIKE